MEEHKIKNLCLSCHEKFLPGHNCQQRQRAQIFLMDKDEDLVVIAQEPVVTSKKEITEDKEPIGEV